MYEEFETRTSYKYLKEVISSLKEPICILGGWAVGVYTRHGIGLQFVDVEHALLANKIERKKIDHLSSSMDFYAEQHKKLLKMRTEYEKMLREVRTKQDKDSNPIVKYRLISDPAWRQLIKYTREIRKILRY